MSHREFRKEAPSDWDAVEHLTREAFWNVYRPGCFEHYLLHILRGSGSVVEALNELCLEDGVLCGHIFYTRAQLLREEGAPLALLTFGPVSVHPSYQRRRIGSELIRRTMARARGMGFPGIVITGNPAYYRRFGFRAAADFGIIMEDGASFPELMACGLIPGGLGGAGGRVRFSPEFGSVDESALLAFDSHFPPKQRLRLPGQLI